MGKKKLAVKKLEDAGRHLPISEFSKNACHKGVQAKDLHLLSIKNYTKL